MADIYGAHFTYGGVSSTTQGTQQLPGYELVIANAETERFRALSGEISGVGIFNKKNKVRYLIDDDYSDSPLSFDVDIITCDETPLAYENRRKIEKWLFNRPQYRKLYIDVADDPEMAEIIGGTQKRLYLNCRFINPEKLEYNGGIVGYKATLEADSSMWWQDAITNTFNISNPTSSSTSSVSVSVDTDLPDYVYPTVTIVKGNSVGDVTIINHADDDNRLTKFENVSANQHITLNGNINYINPIQYYEKFKNPNFPRLLDGTNSITVMGDVATITFEFQNRRHF